MTELIRYEAARHALSVAHEVDEAKEICDKALALAAYAKQAKDKELERWAVEIRVRAERRCGELLAEKKRGVNQHDSAASSAAHSKTEYQQAKQETGISDDQAKRFQRLANIDEADFEEAVDLATADGNPPHRNEVITAAKQIQEEKALPPDELKRIKEQRRKTSETNQKLGPIIETLRKFAGYQSTPAEAAERSQYGGTEWVIDENLDAAVEWFIQFREEWRKGDEHIAEAS